MATTNYGWPLPTTAFPVDVPADLTALGQAIDTELAAAWATYTPVLSGGTWAIGNGTVVGRYRLLGKKTVRYDAMVTFGSTSVFGSSQLEISLPVSAKTGGTISSFSAHGLDVSAATRYLLQAMVIPATSTTKCFLFTTGGASGAMGAVTTSGPFTWANTDIVTVSGIYEAN
ncbi:hypothetical protein ACWEOW_11255 [Monashia sp. NPDC004114]